MKKLVDWQRSRWEELDDIDEDGDDNKGKLSRWSL